MAEERGALKQQTGKRAEKKPTGYLSELASLRWQEPVATLLRLTIGADFEMYYDNNRKLRFEGMSEALRRRRGRACCAGNASQYFEYC